MTTTTEALVQQITTGALDLGATDVASLPSPAQRLLVSAARLAASSGRVDRATMEAGVRELRAHVSATLAQPGELEAMVSLVTIPELRPLSIVLSAALARAGDERALEAAARIGEAALAASAMNEGAALAMRLVRWYEELDRPEAIERAYAEAVRRNPLSAWIVPPAAIGPAAERAERDAIEASEAGPRTVREAVRALRTGADRAGALARLSAEAEAAPEQVAPALLLCVERLRAAAALDPAAQAAELARALDDARGYASRLAPLGAVAVLARAMIAVLGGERDRAIDALAAGLPQLDEDPRAAAAKIADALERELRVPPHAIDDILRRAFFEALIDPFGAFEPPRSALAQLRHWIAGAMLMAAVTGAVAPAAARADTGTADEQAQLEAAGDEADDVAAEEGAGDEEEALAETDDDLDDEDDDDDDGADGDDVDGDTDDIDDDDGDEVATAAPQVEVPAADALIAIAVHTSAPSGDAAAPAVELPSSAAPASSVSAAPVDTAGDGPRGGWGSWSPDPELGGDGPRGGWGAAEDGDAPRGGSNYGFHW